MRMNNFKKIAQLKMLTLKKNQKRSKALIGLIKILTIIDNNKFNYKNKIGKFKYIDIKDLVNNIKNNTISEISAKKKSKYIKHNKKCRNKI